MKKIDSKPLCLVFECDRKKVARGLCYKHYTQAKKLVMSSDNDIYWKDLELAGAVTPKRRRML